MTPEAQRIAIAEACGWKNIFPRQDAFGDLSGVNPADGHYLREHLPDYLNDLNAMHVAIVSQPLEVQARIAQTLHQIVGITEDSSIFDDAVRLMLANAAQRAEAFLKTIGEWTP
jgi:hypothetical protein